MAKIPCTVFSRTNATKICGQEAFAFIPLAIGQIARMQELDDALLCGYVALCVRHSQMTPPAARLMIHSDLGLPLPDLVSDNG